MAKKILEGPGFGFKITLDSAQIFPDDPGMGTPALVELGEHSASFLCALETGELDCGEVLLTNRQSAWLESQEEIVSNWLNEHGA